MCGQGGGKPEEKRVELRLGSVPDHVPEGFPSKQRAPAEIKQIVATNVATIPNLLATNCLPRTWFDECSFSTASVCPCAAVATGVDGEFVAAAAAVGGVAMASL